MDKHSFMKIKTKRLVIRDLLEEDLDLMIDLCMNAEITIYLDYIKCENEQAVRKFLLEKIKYNEETPRCAYNFAILTKDTNEKIGWIGFGDPSEGSNDSKDFGYAIKQEYWGNGYASEALFAIIKFIFSTLSNIDKVFGECSKDNLASIRVMQKCGMSLDTTFSNKDNNSVLYAIYRKQFLIQ